MGPNGARNQEQLCWLDPAAIYFTGLKLKFAVGNVRAFGAIGLDARQSPAGNDVSRKDTVGIRYQATTSEYYNTRR
jgi:hypothetical protein